MLGHLLVRGLLVLSVSASVALCSFCCSILRLDMSSVFMVLQLLLN